MDKRYNIFISHHGKDDDKLQNLKDRLCSSGYNVHNYSVDSTKHKDGRTPTDEVIARFLRMQIKWSGTFICLVGKETHIRKWVDDEIKMAHDQGKRIIGVYAHGHMNVPLPDSLKLYANNVFGWNSIDKIGDAIQGKPLPFENPNSTPSTPLFNVTRVKCK